MAMEGLKNQSKNKNNLLNGVVKDNSINPDDITSKFNSMAESGGFESRSLSDGLDILRSMQKETKCTRFLSFVGALMSTGIRGIIRDMIRHGMFNCVITTCGALDHDIARTYDNYYAGQFRMNDQTLFKKKIHRLGNVLIPMSNYGPLIEEKVQACVNNLYNKQGKRRVSSYEIIDYIGSTLDQSSFLYWAHKNKVPVIVPGIVDGAVGNQIWSFYQQHRDFKIDIMIDETKLSDLVYDAKKSGALMIGGGISKH